MVHLSSHAQKMEAIAIRLEAIATSNKKLLVARWLNGPSHQTHCAWYTWKLGTVEIRQVRQSG